MDVGKAGSALQPNKSQAQRHAPNKQTLKADTDEPLDKAYKQSRTSQAVVVQKQKRKLGHLGNRVQGACKEGRGRNSKHKGQQDK